MQYFFDTSAVVKIYHEEDGSEIVLPLYNGNDNSIVISELSKVEFLSTIHKKFRNKEIDLETVEALKDRFLFDSSNKFIVIPIVSSIVNTALELIISHGKLNSLFSLDALQAAALSIISDNTTIFVCADKKLTSFVKNIGYETLEL